MKEKWLDDWQRAKAEFESLTGKKKPSVKVLLVFRKSSGIESALKVCDKGIKDLEDNWAKGNEKRIQSQAAMRKAIDGFKKTAAAYAQLLDQAISKEVEEQDEKTVYYRGLKMLKARFDQYASSYEASLAFDTAERAKGEQFVDRHWKIAEAKVRAAIAGATAACKTASAAAVAKSAKDAWPVFITEIGRAVRQLRSSFTDVRHAIEHGVKLVSPEKLDKELGAFEDKLPHGPGGVTSQKMLDYIRQLTEIDRAIKSAYRV